MSRSSKPKPTEKGVSSKDVAPFLRAAAEWKGFVNVELGEGTVDQFRAFLSDSGLVQEITAEVLLRGYKLSVVQVDDAETVRATAMSAFAGSVDSGYATSAWGEDFYTAVASVVFIVAIFCGYNLQQFDRAATKASKRTF